ncbi:16S rRNA (adenine(1518)-N(6)/adenine(1519)-N(6))-dimethyltransferase RsmA [Reichenbachiella versicolor]|uniref:16S rRNA (adenine(1518)-N(6)/adenine(1519)-N(6))- dimethyltransferase RsmA n=1 Tax=Reichenbachiella versicolor TaxID=1821036 RepID=UPI000D6DE738|nr:16S rRNA (adenine(1518)-N(6)/adenine(1519)-N(6))-dimethyltransferase RsmA [Reichenbachiella versicolor]
MTYVKPKKRLGQHFLRDLSIAEDIVAALYSGANANRVIEIGPGTGVLSEIIISDKEFEKLILMDLDEESIAFLENKYQDKRVDIVHADFLKDDLKKYFGEEPFSIIGNFPYNISTQIFFKVLDHKDQIREVVGMLQKEVAERIATKEGSKTYGILSVLIQAYYDVEYLFTVPPHVFDPPPKVNSGVIALKRNNVKQLECDEKLFIKVVKASFSTRRKTLRNALKPLNLPESIRSLEILSKRAEQLSVDDFIALTLQIQNT